jgi:DMSO/TMAO reductase YedYZ molybdopterin-dependent catalytic subunit
MRDNRHPPASRPVVVGTMEPVESGPGGGTDAAGDDGADRLAADAAADAAVVASRPAPASDPRVPPGQYLAPLWKVMHYGRPPTFRPDRWDFQVLGATVDGGSTRWSYDDFMILPQRDVVADFHCVTKFSMLDNTWSGVLAATILDAAPPDADATHVLVWADRGYTANLRIDDLRAPTSILAHSRNRTPLSVEHGWPLRLVVPHRYAWKGPKWVRGFEYLTEDRRGFWEERGYHNLGDPWREQRYSYQEAPGDGPALAGTSDD